MLEKYKVFVRGSTETKEVLKEIATKLDIRVNAYEFSDNPDYQFGKCPLRDDSFNIWYTTNNSSPEYFVGYGYKEVTPQQFREIWLGEQFPKKESKLEAFCCKGCEKLREVCQRLAKEGLVNPSPYNDFEKVKDGYYYFVCDNNVVYKVNGHSNGEIVSPEEFYERVSGRVWSEKKKFIGFMGDSHVKISLLPKIIKNPKHLKGNARGCIFYVENEELTYCPTDKVPADRCFEIVSYDTFLLMMYRYIHTKSKQYEKSKFEQLLTPDYCFKSKQETKEANSVQSFVKNPSENFLNLSKQKSLNIIL